MAGYLGTNSGLFDPILISYATLRGVIESVSPRKRQKKHFDGKFVVACGMRVDDEFCCHAMILKEMEKKFDILITQTA